MDISTNNMKLNLNKTRINQKESRWIEQDIIVPDNMPDAIKIVSIQAIPYISDVEINNGRAKIVGKINYFVIYNAADDMNIRGLNVSHPYSVDIEGENLKNKEDIVITSNLKNIIFSLPNERKIAIKNEVLFNIIINQNEIIEVITDFPDSKDIEYNKCKNTFCNIKEKKKCIIASSEDVMLSKDSSAVYEILNVKPRIKDTEYKESYNKIMLKGVLNLEVLYLGENRKICKENVDVTFSSMVELQNITDNSSYKIEYCLRDLNVKINPDIDQKTLIIDYKIEANITVCEKQEVEYISDFYSKTRDLKYDIKDINVASNELESKKEINITDSINDILPEGNKLVDYSLDTTGLLPTLENNKIQVNGIAKLNIIIQNNETMELESKSIDIMVNEEIPLDEQMKDSNVTIDIIDYKLNVNQNERDLNIKVTIYVSITSQNALTVSSIGKIEDEPLSLDNISSINIYIVKKGDTIWKIAKKYKTSMENIIKINELENPDSIDIGQKILVIR